MMKPSTALEKAKELTGQWPHANPPDKNRWLTSIAATLAQYPAAVVDECCDPRVGLAKTREFPPTIAAITEWCDAKLKEYQAFAAYRPMLPKPAEPDYSDEHRQGMLARLSDLMHSLFTAKKHQPWIRPRGFFERPDEHLQQRRPSPNRERPVRKSWRPYTTEELRAMYAPAAEEAAE